MEWRHKILRFRNKLFYYWDTKLPVVGTCLFTILTCTTVFTSVLIIVLISPKTSKTCNFAFKRIGKSSIISNSEPLSLATGDFNNDKQMDVVITMSGVDMIVLLLLYANGTSTRASLYSTGTHSLPRSVTSADVNNDNCLDVAVANYNTHGIKIFLGDCNGTLLNATLLSTGSFRPYFITAGDVNNDKQADLIVVNYNTDSFSIYIGYGDGVFQSPRTYFTGYDSGPCSITIGDFNKNGRWDVAMTYYGTHQLSIMLDYDNGNFSKQQIYTTNLNSHPISLAIGDFNKDTNLDIAVANYGLGNIGIFLNYGNGTFTRQTTYSIASDSRLQQIAVGNFFDKNILDILVVDPYKDQLHVLSGYGNGSFATVATFDDMTGSHPMSAVVADYDNDYLSDVAVINYKTNQLLLLRGCSIVPSFRSDTYLLKGSSKPSTIAISDFNNNTYLDIAVNGYDNDGIRIMYDYKNRNFVQQISLSIGNDSQPQNIATYDLNHDNRIDIVTANTGSNSVSVLLGCNNGSFEKASIYSTGTNSAPRVVAIDDLDIDGHPDIVTANSRSNSMGIFFGYGNGSFAPITIYSTDVFSIPQALAIGNVNNDKLLDIVVSATNVDGIVVFLANNNRTYRISTVYFTGYRSSPYAIALADLNQDNNIDLVVVNSRFNEILILFGSGTGQFEQKKSYKTVSDALPYSVVVADFNYDGQPDIAVTYFLKGQIAIFIGDRYGNLSLERTYSTGMNSHPYDLAIADFNHDKQLEIAVALWGSGFVAILSAYKSVEFRHILVYSIGIAPQPCSMAVGDFNRDNQPDIVLADSGTDSLDVHLGLVSGTFDKNVTYTSYQGFSPRYVITVDVDKDNILDIIAVHSITGTVTVDIGHGNGSFKASMMYFTGSDRASPSFITSGDLDMNGYLDLMFTNEGVDTVGVMLGYNYSVFTNQEAYSAAGSLGSRQVAVGDFNNDSCPDAAVVFYTTSNIGIFLGNCNGSFTTLLTYSTTLDSQPYSLRTDDVNTDGNLDVIVVNSKSGQIGIFLGFGNGSFANVLTFSTGIGSVPQSLAVADFNSDSYLDISVINIGTNSIGIFYGYGNGNFSAMVTYPTEDDSSPSVIQVSDFNNDGRADIVTVNPTGNYVGVRLGYGDGNFSKQVTYSLHNKVRPMWVALGDFNNDNKIDMVTTNYEDNSISILFGFGNGSFTTAKTYGAGTGSMPMYADTGDFNRDNNLDIAVVCYGTNGVVVHFGTGNGTFLGGIKHSTGTDSQPNTLAIADFNKDGQLDILVSNPGSNAIGMFLGNGNKPYAIIQLGYLPPGSQPCSIDAGDLNNDGRLDLIIANYGTNNVAISMRMTDKVADAILEYPAGTDPGPFFVAVHDLNKDHDLDIAVANIKGNSIGIFWGYGNGTFHTVALYSTGGLSHPRAIAISDLDNDSLPDIAVANSGTNNILLFYGTGGGTFNKEESYPLGYAYLPYSIALEDLNHDGFIDIIIACYGTNNVEILLKTC